MRYSILLSPLILIILSLLYQISQCYTTSEPTWLTSPYFRANNQKVISTLTGNDSTPTYTFTFSSALTGVPNLAYGIKNYRGNDMMMNEKFQIRRETLTAATFKVSMQIFGVTNLHIVTVAYLAIDPTFPHHLNSFDNVPVNISNGNLVNISTPTIGTTTYTNYIDYSIQSAANNFSTFQTPLSSNKIVLFMSSLFILSKNFPLKVSIQYEILNTTFYKWTATIDRNITIERLHFSQIVYNQDDVSNSGVYAIVYEQWTVDKDGGYRSFPLQLVDNMIMAIRDFQTVDAACGFEYNWYFVTNQSGYAYSIKINASEPIKGFCGFDSMRSTLFYIKTWECAAPYIYYNLTADNCQDQCAGYYLQNVTSTKCQACHYACIQCTVPGDQFSCAQCENGTHRTLINGSCECDAGYFDDGYSAECIACGLSVTNCATCSYSLNSSLSQSDYETIFASGTWPADISVQFTCSTCDSPYFINTTSDQCQTCTLNYCLTCTNLTACSVCDNNASALIYTDSLCYLCTLNNCTICSADEFCDNCQDDYNLINGTCLNCSQCMAYQSLNNITMTQCDSQCFIVETDSQAQFIVAQQSDLIGLLVFALGFRVIGMEMLFVFQNFQLVVDSYNVGSFGMSSNFHGYSDESVYPFEIPNNNNLQQNYNFMLILVLGLFGLGIILQAFGQCCSGGRNQIIDQSIKRKDQSYPIKKNHRKSIQIKNTSQLSEQSQHAKQFAVHYQKKIQHTQTPETTVNLKDTRLSADLPESQAQSTSKVKILGSVILQQIFYDLLINCLCVFCYYLAKQVLTYGTSQLTGFSSIITIGSTILLLFGMMCFCSFENDLFGENQLKFKHQKWMQYWSIVIAERIVYSIILSAQHEYSIVAITALKLIVIVTFIFSENYFEKIQKIRSVSIQTLHFLLLAGFTCNEQFLKHQGILPQFFMEILYLTILGIVLIITLAFYMRQVLFYCSADFRHDNPINSEESEQVSKQSSYRNAVFDVQSQQISQYSSESIKKSISPNFQNQNQNDQDYSQNFLDPKGPYAVARSKKIISAASIKAPPSTSKKINTNNNTTKQKFQIHKRKHAKDSFNISKNSIIFDDLNISNKNDDVSMDIQEEQFNNNSNNNNTSIKNNENDNNNVFNQPSLIFDEPHQQRTINDIIVKPPIQKSTKILPVKTKKYMKSTRRIGHKNKLNQQQQQQQTDSRDYKMKTQADEQTKENGVKSQLDLYKKKKVNTFGDEVRNTPKKNKTYFKMKNNNDNLMAMSTGMKKSAQLDEEDGYDAISINFE